MTKYTKNILLGLISGIILMAIFLLALDSLSIQPKSLYLHGKSYADYPILPDSLMDRLIRTKICPFCTTRSKLYIDDDGVTKVGNDKQFFDEYGHYRLERETTWTTLLRCSNGHKFHVITKGMLP